MGLLVSCVLFDELKIISYVKTSGKTGLHIIVPVIHAYTYDQIRAFAEIVGRILTTNPPKELLRFGILLREEVRYFLIHPSTSYDCILLRVAIVSGRVAFLVEP